MAQSSKDDKSRNTKIKMNPKLMVDSLNWFAIFHVWKQYFDTGNNTAPV